MKKETRIPPGYKETELGIIPKDWEVKRIIDFATVTTGSQNTQDKSENGKYPFYVRSQQVERINKYTFDADGVVTAGDGDIGDIFHRVVGKFGLHQRCYLIHQFKEVSPDFFFWSFRNDFRTRVMKMTAKSSVDSVRREMVADMLVPIPPKKEQERIAGVLSDVDELIATIEKAIEKKRAIKTGAMQQLLTGKTRLPGFSAPWVEKTLGDIQIRNGQMLKSEDYKTGNVPVIAGGITPAGFHNVSNRPVNTITISASGANAGYVSFHPKPIFASDCSTVNEQKNFSVHFLYFYLLYKQEDIYKCQTGGAQPHIHAKDIKNIPLLYPLEISEQRAIAEVLSNMDAEIETLEAKREKLIQVKQGMMQELLTGKTRLL